MLFLLTVFTTQVKYTPCLHLQRQLWKYSRAHYAVSLAPRGITVNIVASGYIKTEAWEGYLNAVPYLKKMPPNVTPMQRWGEVEDVAPLVAFLCSQESGFITGQHIYVDGGVGLSLFWNIHKMSQNL